MKKRLERKKVFDEKKALKKQRKEEEESKKKKEDEEMEESDEGKCFETWKIYNFHSFLEETDIDYLIF